MCKLTDRYKNSRSVKVMAPESLQVTFRKIWMPLQLAEKDRYPVLVVPSSTKKGRKRKGNDKISDMTLFPDESLKRYAECIVRKGSPLKTNNLIVLLVDGTVRRICRPRSIFGRDIQPLFYRVLIPERCVQAKNHLVRSPNCLVTANEVGRKKKYKEKIKKR